MVRLRIWALALTLTLVLAGCQTPADDPDAAVRELLSNKLWYPDPTVTDNPAPALYLYADGSAAIDGTGGYSWSYKNEVLTITGKYGAEATNPPTVTKTTLVCTLNQATCWFTTQP
jgi:hypothetical protein